MIDERRLNTLNNLLVRYPEQKVFIRESLYLLIGTRIKSFVEQAFLSAPVEELEAMLQHIDAPVTTPVVTPSTPTTPVVTPSIPTTSVVLQPTLEIKDDARTGLVDSKPAKDNGKSNSRVKTNTRNKKHDKVGKDLLE